MQVEQLNSTDASTRHKVAACVRELEGEIRTLQKLKHPNIVQYLGFERTETHFNIFLEWMPGGSIRKLLDDFGAPQAQLRYFRRYIATVYTFRSRSIWGLVPAHHQRPRCETVSPTHARFVEWGGGAAAVGHSVASSQCQVVT